MIDGPKLQGCNPGLVVSRAAIIAAAEVRNTTNRDDNREAFDTHPDCRLSTTQP